jgi:diguanylate cyclase (GGDEF)-like protein
MAYSESLSFNRNGMPPNVEKFSPLSVTRFVFDAREKQTIIRVRWLVISAASYLLLLSKDILLPRDVVHAVVLMYVLSNASLHVLEQRFFESLRFLATLVVLDTLALSFALLVTGQLGSDFYLGYFLILIITGFWKDFRWSVAFGLLLAAFYGFLLFLAESVTTSLLLRLPFVLAASVFYAYFVEIVKKEHALREKAEKEARHDFLTGLPNRQAFQQRIMEERERSLRYERALSLLMVDIDNFKSVNDVFGHHWGDIVLQKVAEQLNKAIRKIDFIARIGGEEFVIILPETDLNGAFEVANRVLSAVRESPIETTKGLLRVTVSIGISSGFGEVSADQQQLILDADQALYRAKQCGKDRVEALCDTARQGWVH